MIPSERTYHYKVELLLSRSHVLKYNNSLKDDIVNWLFAHIGDSKYGFVYKIEEVESASFEQPFLADASFLAIEFVTGLLKLGDTYEVSRGEEQIGSLKIVEIL